MEAYNHKKVEKKWQSVWEKSGSFIAEDRDKRPKWYSLIEFPYPSGDGLHVGHIRSNTAMDVISRKRRAEGFNVLYPIGWDAFGLPTENYAIKTGIQPKIVTKKNTDNFRRQLKALGFSFDWSREINTTDPAYYKWTQWIFLELFKRGLAYKKKMAINWCPKDKIGLANEEVVDGKCERCGTLVEKREKEQWMLAITKYADRLDKDLDTVDFLSQIKLQQRNWIGKSNGSLIKFRLSVTPAEAGVQEKKTLDSRLRGNDRAEIEVFTTRPDTLFGATYLVLSPEHPLVKNLESRIKNQDEVKKYIAETKKKTEIERTAEDKEKTGVRLEGVTAVNPANNEEIPIWIADYVLADYGTGAIMAVPAHDERDFAFAKKYNLPVRQVVERFFRKETGEDAVKEGVPVRERDAVVCVVKHWSEDKFICLAWKKNDWKGFVIGGVESGESLEQAGIREIAEETGYTTAQPIARLGRVHSQFFHKVKNENRFAHFTGMYFELQNDTRIETDQREKDLHDVRWVSRKEVFNFLNREDMKRVWADASDYFAGKKESCVAEYGILINSGKFNNLTSEEAKKKITEAVGGKIVTTYKLRDWVFSRQRYWGEPIPLVFCTQCFATKNNLNAVIVHGCPSNAEIASDVKRRTYDKHWIPWTKKQLEKLSIKTSVPLMPTPWQASYEEWKKEFEKQPITEKTILIGHSCGAAFLVRWLGETKRKVFALILVAPWKIPHGSTPEKTENRSKFYTYEIDPEIKDRVGSIIIFTSNDEEEDGKNSVHIFQDALRAKVIELNNRGHYIFEDMKTEEFPEIISEISSFSQSVVPVPEKDLPVKLPEVKNYQPTDTGESPLAAISKWVNVKCPVCGGKARRETDTMPNWAGSSWYYLRYIDPKNKKEFVGKNKLNYWSGVSSPLKAKSQQLKASPVDWYNGGMEHTTLHLLYSRFWHKFLYDCGYVPTSEPYAKRTSHGLILAGDNEKMSKSRGNVINPDEIVERFGADALRVYEMFMGPFDQAIAWNTDGLVGTRRFLEKVWRLGDRIMNNESGIKEEKTLNPKPYTLNASLLHQTIKKVTDDIEAMRFNTAISALMILANEMESVCHPRENGDPEKTDWIPASAGMIEGKLEVGDFKIFLQLLAPFAPHISEELWSKLGKTKSIQLEPWPKYDASKLVSDSVKITVQINGRVRAVLDASRDSGQSAVESLAKSDPGVSKWLGSSAIKKVIYVPNRLINFVV